MKIQLLPTTFDSDGRATQHQHSCCFVVNDYLAIDAGSLAQSTNEIQKKQIRDVILTHAHLDHIAGLPIFIDDLFANIKRTLQIHATQEVIEALEQNIFNWVIYPRFSELKNKYGEVLKYCPFKVNQKFRIKDVEFESFGVNHKVPTVGFIFGDEGNKVALTGDTAQLEEFWDKVNQYTNLKALLIECAFPNELSELANSSHHLTPHLLNLELKKFNSKCPIYLINIKPMYRETILSEIEALNNPQINILELGKVYEF